MTHGYVVQRGDTLSGIALAAHVPLTTVTALNHLAASDVIVPGQRLLLPGPAPDGRGARGDRRRRGAAPRPDRPSGAPPPRTARPLATRPRADAPRRRGE